MKKKAQDLGFAANIYSYKFQAEARKAGEELIKNTKNGTILLVGGETTVKVTGAGAGGRNQEVILGALSFLDGNTLISSFDSDGWDNSHFAGAIGDIETVKKAKELNLNPQEFLDSDSSLSFLKNRRRNRNRKTPSNVSDLMIVCKF